MELLHLKLGNIACHPLIPFVRTAKYHNQVRVSLLPEISKTLILADLYVVSIFLNSVAIRTFFPASVTGTLGRYLFIYLFIEHIYPG